MTFDNAAKNLLRSAQAKPTNIRETHKGESLTGRARTLYELALNDFAPEDICRELRALYDEAEEVSEKKQILELVIKVQGMMQESKEKEVPQIVFNICGRPDRIDSMLCPEDLGSHRILSLPIPNEIAEMITKTVG